MKNEPWYILPQIKPASKRVIVIGGGLAGTSAAYSIAVRGWEVTLIERAVELASAASGNPVGILTPLITHKNDPIGEFYLQGFEHSLKHIKNLSGSQQLDFHNSGVLELGRDKIDKEIADTIIPAADIRKLSTAEASHLCGVELNSNALYMDKCGFINPADLCRANIVAGGDNIKVIFSQEILSLERSKNGWSVLGREKNEIAAAPVVIIANAADAASFLQASWVPVQRVRGQLTYLPARGFGLTKILCYDGGYITPEIRGFHYVGATYSREDTSAKINIADHITNIENLKKIIDIGGVDINSLQGRVSFRAGIIDRRPVIGPVPDINAFEANYADLHHGRKYKEYPAGKYMEGLYISTGYGSRGLTSCPLGGELLAAMINNDKPPLAEEIINTLSPTRFIIKKLKQGA